MAARSTRTARTVGALAVALVILVGVGIGTFVWLRGQGLADPVPGQQRCVATAGDQSVVLDLDQARLTSIIVGLSVRRGLPPRAATIAMATVYQETGIRNLDYGDRDSVGLFQQRPSQGWGSVEQIMDPYYATGKFYDALVKIDDWEDGDITEMAQQVQRSGYPDAYRDHEADARVLASALTGHSPGGLTCLERGGNPGKAKALATSLQKTFGGLDDATSGSTVTIRATSKARAWAYGHYAVANAERYGVTGVVVGDQQWQTDTVNLPVWTDATNDLSSREVVITVR